MKHNKLLTMGLIGSVTFAPVVFSSEALTDYESVPDNSNAEPSNADYTEPQSIPGLTLFTDRALFNTYCANSQTEDFENNLGPFDIVGFEDPLDEFTNNAVFATSAIQPGILFDTVNNTLSDLALVGPGFSNNTSHALFSNLFSDTLNIKLTNNDVTCVGMDLGSLFSASTLDISIDGSSEPLGVTTSPADTGTTTFWGVVSSVGPIRKIHLSSQTGQAEGVDNVTFGTGTPLSCVGGSFEPPLNVDISITSKSKRVIPVKMSLVNDLTGEPVGEGDITPPVVNVMFNPVSSSPSDVTDDLLSAGAANDDNIFRFSAEENKWVYNMGTKSYSAPGDYIVTVMPGDSTYTIDPASCNSTFSRLE